MGRVSALLLSLALLTLAACGSVPRPFASDGGNPLVEDHRAMAVVVVRAPDLPGAPEAMVTALEREDIGASTTRDPFGALHLDGHIDNDDVVWTLTGSDGAVLAERRIPRPPRLDKPALAVLADRGAPYLAKHIRGEDSGAQDLEARPHVQVRTVTVPPDIDPKGLTEMMRRALAGQNMIISDDQPVALVDGTVRLLPGTAPGTKTIEVVWLVRNPQGNEVGRVSQSGPADTTMLLGTMGPVARDIAAAGAPAVAEVIRVKLVGK